MSKATQVTQGVSGKGEPKGGHRLRLKLPILLPEVDSVRDECIDRVITLLKPRPGILDVHIADDCPEGEEGKSGGEALLCLHYDPEVLPLQQVESLARAAGAEITQRYSHAVFGLRVIDTEDAARRIEQTICALQGVTSVTVNLAAQVVRVEWERSSIALQEIQAELKWLGYEVATPTTPAQKSIENQQARRGWVARNKELVLSLLAGVLLLAAWSVERWLLVPHGLVLAMYLSSYAVGAWDLLGHTLTQLRRRHLNFSIDLLMLLAAVGAAVLGKWVEGAFLLFLFSLAHALEHYALGKARNAIRSLADLAPAKARVVRNSQETEIPVEQVAVKDIVLVRPAERIPVDGTIQKGHSSVNQAPITGESVPVEKQPGDPVFAGTVNGDGALEITTTRAVGDRTLDRVVKLVEEAQTQKAPTQQFTDRFARIFVPTVLICDVALILVPPLLGFWGWSLSLYRGMALLVAASPCALALGTPAAVLSGIAQAARHGILIKGGAHLENLGSLRAVAFDKTGTLTEGRPEVTDIAPFGESISRELLRVAASVETKSQHPLAQAVARRAKADEITLAPSGELQSTTARGVRAEVEGHIVEIGSSRLWEEQSVAVPAGLKELTSALQARGRSTMIVKHGPRWLGVIGVADSPRDGVRDLLAMLRRQGLGPLVMLTGDNKGVGAAVGKEVGIDEVHADLLPEDKVGVIREMSSRLGMVAMVGDGVNDAPALANATVGIAMGGAGTATALETADVALMGDDLSKLPFAIGLSRRTRQVIRQNLYISLGVIGLLVASTVSGVVGIGWAVIIHEGSTLVVIGNALRLLTFKGPRVSHALG